MRSGEEGKEEDRDVIDIISLSGPKRTRGEGNFIIISNVPNAAFHTCRIDDGRFFRQFLAWSIRTIYTQHNRVVIRSDIFGTAVKVFIRNEFDVAKITPAVLACVGRFTLYII